MHIYIDESGSFSHALNGSPGFSCIGALVIPEANSVRLFKKCRFLFNEWGMGGQEVKGKGLNELQVATVIEKLEKSGARFFVVATVMSHHPKQVIDFHRDVQARRLTASLTEKHHPNLVFQLREIAERVRRMSGPEYIQLSLLTKLVENVLRGTLSHFAFNGPAELGEFIWKIDAKNRASSSYEVCWDMLGGGFLQTIFLERPFMVIPGGDYSIFDKSFLASSQEWPDYLGGRPGSAPGKVTDLRALLKRSFSFEDSRQFIGLQLADIVTNAFRRAVVGNLQEAGWKRLGRLLLRFEKRAIDLLFFQGPDFQGPPGLSSAI